MGMRDESEDLKSFLKGRIDDLTQKREEYQNNNDYEMDDYLAGAIDAYDIIWMKLTNEA
jgi:hypothetical protein